MLLEEFQSGPAKVASKVPHSLSSTKSPRKKKRRKEELQEKAKRNLESDLHAKVEEALRKRSTKPLVGEMAAMLLSEEGKQDPSQSKVGLFVDWLEMMDPELYQLDEEVQQQLLFSKCLLRVSSGKKSVARSSRSCRPYVLTMLTHQSGWKSLRSVVGRVLERHNDEFQASAVLDFLAACAYIPKLWHGMDKHQPKHASPTDVLDLSEEQIKVLVDYHLAEADGRGSESEASADNVFRPRMVLLLRCLSTRVKANAAVEHLFWKIVSQGSGNEGALARRLLMQVYLGRPSCLIHLQTGGLDDTRTASLLPGMNEADAEEACTLDVATHTLLSALSETRHGRAWAAQMLEFEAAAR